MKQVLILLSVLFFINCGSPKKKNTETAIEPVEKQPTTENEEVAETTKEIAKEDIIVILKRPNQLTETKDLIKNNGLEWDKLLFDQDALKVGLIKVPAEKKEYWLNQLIESGKFDDVQIYSEKALKELVEKKKEKKH